MTQATQSYAPAGERDAAPAVFLRTLPWIFFILSVLAPLALVVAATLSSDAALPRAEMIVQGSQLLAAALLLAAVLSLLYVLGAREAELVTLLRAPSWRASEGVGLPQAR